MYAISTKSMPAKSFIFLLFCIIMSTTMIHFAHSQPKPFHIVLLAGQSNMAGQGGVRNNVWDNIVPPECTPNPDILRLNNELQWEVAKEPLHAGLDIANVSNGIGPGIPFATSLLEKIPGYGVLGLVPCANSGSKIIQWQRGTDFYNELVRRATAALASSGGREIEALLWYQGESDTMRQTDSGAYKERLQQFIVTLRTDLNSPNLLVIQVALASGGRHYIEIVRQAQLHTDLARVTCVDAKGLPLQSDRLHLSTPGQVALGNMLSDAFICSSGITSQECNVQGV